MDKRLYRLAQLIIVLSLVGMTVYAFARFALVPFVGFTFDGPDGYIYQVSADSQLVQPGDVIEEVNGVPWAEYTADQTRANFAEYRRGDTIPLRVRRAGQTVFVAWTVPGPTATLVVDRFFDIMLAGPVFWFFALLVLLLIRPFDMRWFLLIAFYSLAAVWILAGVTSSSRVLFSPTVLRALTWPLVAVLLHYHWIFPRPLRVLPRLVPVVFHGLTAAMMAAELAQLPPRSAYGLAALGGVVGSLVLLVLHAWREPDSRRDLRLIMAALVFIVLAAVGLNWLGQVLNMTNLFTVTIAFLCLIPFIYFYLAYRRQTGGMEVRSNRWVSFLLYAQAYLILAILGLGIATLIGKSPESRLLLVSAIILFLGLIGTAQYVRIQKFFEQHVLGITLPSDEMVDAFTRRVATSPDRRQLQDIWERDILPSLLVRQALVLYFPETNAHGIPCRTELVARLNVPDGQLPAAQDLLPLLQTGPAHPPAAGWVRLALPLAYRGRTIGVALFGRRDPDDEYSAALLPILRTLLSQTALILVNTGQAELIHAQQRYEIERREEEQRRLAHDLHDDVLGQMTLIARHVDPGNEPFRQAQLAAVQRVRDIISGLRPSTLSIMGLYPAIGELLDELDERARDSGQNDLSISLEIQPSQARYSADVELAVYRIVQQACQNAIKHAQANHLVIRGLLDADCMELSVEDDGKGFTAFARSELTPMLIHQHYGLLNMYERAGLINAGLEFDSAPGKGTRVRLTWKA